MGLSGAVDAAAVIGRLAASIGEPDVARAAWEGLQPGLRMELGDRKSTRLNSSHRT